MTDDLLMQRALALAELGRLTVSPNPMVGCVIVADGEIVGEGYHQRAGEPHAEVHALRDAGDKARGAHAYVTLEPCCHTGRTPPCTKALIAAGIKKVTIATLDSNPMVAEKGVKELQEAGIEVIIGIEEQAAKSLNRIYFHHRKFERPFVISKWAMSLDGKTSTGNDDRKISSSESHQHSHRTRSIVDAILIGANTARLDNPLLTTRLTDIAHKHPLRIVITKSGNLPLDLKIFDRTLPTKTMIATTKKSDPPSRDNMTQNGIEVMTVAENENGDVDLKQFLNQLGKSGITSLLVEGGMSLHQQFFKQHLVDQTDVYIAPIIIGDGKKVECVSPQWNSINNDIHCSAMVKNIEEN